MSAAALLRFVPAKGALVRFGARLSPSLRTPLVYRTVSALARRTPGPDDIETNLGIAGALVCRIPRRHDVQAFGTPALYRGERGALELAAQWSTDADSFFDIGAHLGYFTFHVRARGPAGLPIYCFEPDVDLHAMLAANLERNALRGVTLLPVAVGDADRSGTFYRDRSDDFSGSLVDIFADRHEVAPQPVRVRSFASLAAEFDVHRALVKVDVEGAERQFMEGATGAFDRIRAIIVEVLGPAHSGGFVQALMARTGMQAYYINDYTLEHSPDGSFVYREPDYNWFFCHETPAALAAKVAAPLRVRGQA
jgi:FkbM family methyltransferase